MYSFFVLIKKKVSIVTGFTAKLTANPVSLRLLKSHIHPSIEDQWSLFFFSCRLPRGCPR